MRTKWCDLHSVRLTVGTTTLLASLLCGVSATAADRGFQSHTVNSLIATLHDPHASLTTKIAACDGLREAGSRARDAVEPLIGVLARPGPLRQHAAAALKALGAAAVTPLSDAVLADDVVVADAAGDVLAAMGDDARPVVARLALALTLDNPQRYRMLAGIFQGLGPIAVDATPSLLRDLMNLRDAQTDTVPDIRAALMAIRPDDAPDAADVVHTLMRNGAYDAAYDSLDSRYKLTIPAVIVHYREHEGPTQSIERALKRIGPADTSEIPALLWLATVYTPVSSGADLLQMRKMAIDAIGKVGPAAAPGAASTLIGTLNHNDLGDAAAAALMEIAPSDNESLTRLILYLGDPASISTRAARVLSTIGSKASPAVEPLRRCLRSEERPLQAGAAGALASIGPAAAPAVPELMVLLRSGDTAGTTAAVSALGAIGSPAAKPASGALLDTLRRVSLTSAPGTSSDSLRQACVKALSHIDPDDPMVADLLLSAVRRKDWVIRESLAPALSQSKSRPSLETALSKLAEDPDSLVRINARCALREIQSPHTPGG